MIFYVGAILILLLAGGKSRLRDFHAGYLSKDATDAVRGVFILLIFASHFVPYLPGSSPLADPAYARVRTALGQSVVTCFLFYSGYGVALSAAKKGDAYVQDMPRRRILSTLLAFDCAVLLYMALLLFRGGSCSVKTFLLSLLAWNSVGNSNWYIFSILCLYAATWLVLRRRPVDRSAALGITTLSLGLLLFLICAGKEQWWYDTLLCYPLGIWYYLYKSPIDRFMARNAHYYPVLALTLLAYVLAHKGWKLHLSLYILTMLLFTLCVVFLTMKFDIRNPFLRYCGRHLTGLYLLQRIPMILLRPWFATRSSLLAHSVYFLLSLALTFALDAVFCRWIKAMGIGVKQASQQRT